MTRTQQDGQHRTVHNPAANYRIVRFYQSDEIPSRTIKTGLTLEQAQAHCNDPETSSSTATSAAAKRRTARLGPWFDGYTDRPR